MHVVCVLCYTLSCWCSFIANMNNCCFDPAACNNDKSPIFYKEGKEDQQGSLFKGVVETVTLIVLYCICSMCQAMEFLSISILQHLSQRQRQPDLKSWLTEGILYVT